MQVVITVLNWNLLHTALYSHKLSNKPFNQTRKRRGKNPVLTKSQNKTFSPCNCNLGVKSVDNEAEAKGNKVSAFVQVIWSQTA